MDILRATIRLEVAADGAFERKPILHDLQARLEIENVATNYSGRYVVPSSGVTVHTQDMAKVELLYIYNLGDGEVRVGWSSQPSDVTQQCSARLEPYRALLVTDVAASENVMLTGPEGNPALVEILIAGR